MKNEEEVIIGCGEIGIVNIPPLNYNIKLVCGEKDFIVQDV